MSTRFLNNRPIPSACLDPPTRSGVVIAKVWESNRLCVTRFAHGPHGILETLTFLASRQSSSCHLQRPVRSHLHSLSPVYSWAGEIVTSGGFLARRVAWVGRVARCWRGAVQSESIASHMRCSQIVTWLLLLLPFLMIIPQRVSADSRCHLFFYPIKLGEVQWCWTTNKIWNESNKCLLSYVCLTACSFPISISVSHTHTHTDALALTLKHYHLYSTTEVEKNGH